MSKALQIWSHTFCSEFDHLPAGVKQPIQDQIDEMGRRLQSFPHHRLTGRPQFRLRGRDYRVIYTFDVQQGVIHLLYVGHRRDVYK